MKISKKIAIFTSIISIPITMSPFVVSCSVNKSEQKNILEPNKSSPLDSLIVDKTINELMNREEETLKKFFKIVNPENEKIKISDLIEKIETEKIEPLNYKSGELKITIKTINGYSVINITEILFKDTNPQWPTFEELESSGKLGNIIVSKYFKIINDMGILTKPNIWNINNATLKTDIDKLEYNKNQELEIKIIYGNQSEGRITLELNGTYKGNNIQGQKIDISGFEYINVSDYLYLNDFTLNKNEYIKNLQDDQTIKSWDESTIFNYLTTFKTQDRFVNKIIDIKLLYERGDMTNFIFENLNTNGKVIKISADTKNAIYNNDLSIWEENKKRNYFKGDFKININEDDYINFLYSDCKINDIVNNSQIYASSLYSDWKRGLDTVNDYFKLNEKVIEKYLPNEEIHIETEAMKINDLTGDLTWISNIASRNGTLYGKESLSATYKGFKKINDLGINPIENQVFIMPDIDSSFYKSIIRDVKPNFAKIKDLAINSSIVFNTDAFPRSFEELEGFGLYSSTIPKDPNFSILETYRNRGVQFFNDFYNDNLLEAFTKGGRTQLLNGIFIETVYTNIKNNSLIITRKDENTWTLNGNMILTFLLIGSDNNGSLSFSRDSSIKVDLKKSDLTIK